VPHGVTSAPHTGLLQWHWKVLGEEMIGGKIRKEQEKNRNDRDDDWMEE
jgi:hypothetical protein